MDTKGQKLTIPVEASGLRLDKWLMNLYPHIKYGEWARLLRKGHIRLDNKRVTGSERLESNQTLRLPPLTVLEASTTEKPLPIKKSVFLSPQREASLKSWILYEDNDLMVLNKPAGLAVQGGSKQTLHLDGLLQSFGQKTGTIFKLVHRLDRETSGILVVAKTLPCAAALAGAFKYHQLSKVYVALTQGVPTPLQGTITDPITLQTVGTKEKMVIDPIGKKAVTFYEIISHAAKKASCVALSPQTGRTHQLRVHLAGRNCPILGDGQYGDTSVFWPNLPKQLYLHSYKITLTHPMQHKKMTFSAPLPSYFIEALDVLGMDYKDILRGLDQFNPDPSF